MATKESESLCSGRVGLAFWSICAILGTLSLFRSLLTAQCLECHGSPDFTTTDSTGATVSLYVDTAVFDNSIHGILSCTDCHTAATEIPHPDHMPPVDCGSCHTDVAKTYQYHGFKREESGELFPDCHDCHGTHDILSPDNPKSSANPNNLPTTCGRCHEDEAIVKKYHIPMITPVEIYETSVHSRRTGKDSSLVASCIDCHSIEGTAHVILSPINPKSTIYHFNISATCGQCHPKVQDAYERGVHGQAYAKGETDTPVCIDCHGSHAILPVDDPKSRVSPTNVSMTVCAPCHADDQLSVKFGLPTNIMETWQHSYHGLKSTDGDPRVANCSSCHRPHLILPASDSASSIAPGNVQKTCSRCHPDISPELARIEIHKTTGVFLNQTGKTVRAIYIIAIVVIIGSMIVHWLIDLHKRIRVLNKGQQVPRMNRNELWQHTFLMVTFTVLAITGFAFHFSGSWWARMLFGWPGGFVVRRTIHLVAGVLFIGTAIWHVIYLLSNRGKAFLRDIFPRVRDFRQFFQTMGHDLGLRRDPPEFGRFSYIEKAEYWALVWGTVVMVITGVALWFGTITESFLQVGALGVMLVVHFYEAILAGLAILIWHFYSTIFNPPVYPNNPSWYTGEMPLEMYREEHPADPILEELTGEMPGKTEESEPGEKARDTSQIGLSDEPEETSDGESGDDTEGPGDDKEE